MRTRVAVFILCLMFALSAAPAFAQYGVRSVSNRATGENYRVEISGNLWNPTPDIGIASESLPGIVRGCGVIGVTRLIETGICFFLPLEP